MARGTKKIVDQKDASKVGEDQQQTSKSQKEKSSVAIAQKSEDED